MKWYEWIMLVAFLGILAFGMLLFFSFVCKAYLYLGFWHPVTILLMIATCLAIYSLGRFLEDNWSKQN